MLFSGFQKLTLLDFPGKTAATAFSPGCNFRCPFCHNARLVVPGEGETEHVGEEEILAYMAKRRGLLDGLCLTGGEPTLQADLPNFCRKVKKLGLLVKLDTNGFRPDAVRRLIDEKLVDYVAMDVKNSRERYAETAGLPEIDLPACRKKRRALKRRPCGLRIPHHRRLPAARPGIAAFPRALAYGRKSVVPAAVRRFRRLHSAGTYGLA